MAIFAKKKDGRRQNQAAANGAASDDVVHIEVPDRHAHDGVWTKATLATAQGTAEDAGRDTQAGAKESRKQDSKEDRAANATSDHGADRASDARMEARTDSPPEHKTDGGAPIPGQAPAAATDAAASNGPGPAAAESAGAPEIEPVDIEPEVIETPAEPPLVFGIADAIRLMRSLPADPNIDLVVRVVRVTLGAVNVSVDDILRDGEKKELKVRESIAALEAEVVALEKTLQEKRASIAAHQADLRETATVRERLHMADKYTPHPPPLPPDAVRVALPKPRDWENFDADPFKTKDT